MKTFFTYTALLLIMLTFAACEQNTVQTQTTEQEIHESASKNNKDTKIKLDLAEANRLAKLPMDCIQNQWPYKSGIILSKPSDNALPIEHHPAFYGCFDWHSAVHGHWSLIYLAKQFPELENREEILTMIGENLTKENIKTEVEYFSLNRDSKSFERTYGWAWVFKLAEELYTWEDDKAQEWYQNLIPLTDYISSEYQTYLPKLVYPIRVGEHSNTAFGMSFSYDYAVAVGDNGLKSAIEIGAKRFYTDDADCPISWEPSGYDFLSPCLQELDIMRKILPDEEFTEWSRSFLPSLFDGNLVLDPATVTDRSDGKLVHLDGLNFSRAWCLYSLSNCNICVEHADTHLQYSLDKVVDGDYAGQHWLASFALYAFKSQNLQ
jgi:hypothetical protein